jgi:hypothetical protein
MNAGRRNWAVGSALFIALTTAAGCVKGPFLYSEKIIGETVHTQVAKADLKVIAVLPENPQRRFDYQVAARATTTLEQLGWTVSVPQAAAARKFTAVTDLCKVDGAPDAIVLVTWNYLSLWNCDTGKVAYEVDGGYAGVDAMAQRLTQLATGNATETTASR